MVPVIQCLRADRRFDVRFAVTAQHREMLDQVLRLFHLRPDYDFDLMEPQQSPTQVTSRVLDRLTPVLQREKPDVVLVHGDTLTAFAAALASYYLRIPVAHVESGLRSHMFYEPFPEEANRRLISPIASVHFCPTLTAKRNLLNENIDEDRVYLTGNSVIDALHMVLKPDYVFSDRRLQQTVRSGRRIITVTVHRRENQGEPMRNVFSALLKLVRTFDDIEVIFPMHLNPAVRNPAKKMLASEDRIHLIEPPDYVDFVHLLRASTLIMTDSGGLQEEAPALKRPVVVLRKETERPEGVRAGVAVLVGTDVDAVFGKVSQLLSNDHVYEKMRASTNPYGDGRAATRIRDGLLHALRSGGRPADFKP